MVDQHDKPVSGALIVSGFKGAKDTEPRIAVMDQVDKQFKPEVLTISAGQSVSFPNSDNIRHHVYSFSKTKPFEIKLYSGVPGRPIQFDNAGVVVLGCNIHDKMVGYIYVTESSESFYEVSSLTDETGSVEIQLQGLQSLRVWHQSLINLNQAITIPKVSNIKDNHKIQITLKEENSDSKESKRKFGRKFKRPSGL